MTDRTYRCKGEGTWYLTVLNSQIRGAYALAGSFIRKLIPLLLLAVDRGLGDEDCSEHLVGEWKATCVAPSRKSESSGRRVFVQCSHPSAASPF